MEIAGKIKAINDQQTFGQNGFRKRDMVLETEDQYPHSILIEFVQDKCDLLDKFYVGDGVTIAINLRGREWINPEGIAKYFNSVQGWKIELTNANSERGTGEIAPDTTTTVQNGEPDDLPF
jgi:hypothetical protein